MILICTQIFNGTVKTRLLWTMLLHEDNLLKLKFSCGLHHD